MANYNLEHPAEEIKEAIEKALTSVQQEAGKGLSTNDYTTAEKNKLAGLQNYDDTAIKGRVSTIEGKEDGWDAKADIDDIPTKTSELTNDSGFVTNAVNDLANYYLKTETYSKPEVNELIAAIKQFTVKVVSVLPTASASTMNIIYLIPSTSPAAQNVKDEYITVDNGEEATTRYTWEQIGSTAIDISGKADKVESAVSGNLAGLDSSGNLTDSGKKASDFATAAQGALAASAYQKPASGIPEGDLASAVAAKLNDMDVFTATYGTTTYAQVAAARTAGKEVIVAYSGKVYRLYFLDGTTCYFSALFGFTSLMMYLSSANAWWADNRTLAERTAQVAVADSVAAQELAPNTLYVFASRTSDLALSFGTAVSGEECEYKFKLPIGATLPTISGLSGVTWASGAAPSWAVNKTYEVSIVNGVGVFIEY